MNCECDALSAQQGTKIETYFAEVTRSSEQTRTDHPTDIV
jgi:hypothetical protein